MRKGRFLLLMTLILSFVFALSASTMAVFAEEEGSEGGSSSTTETTVTYSDLWTGGTITKDETKGMCVSVESGNQASYKYEFTTGEGKSFTFSAETSYTESDVKNLFYVNVLSDTNSAILYFDSDSNVKVNSADGEGKKLTSFENITVSVKDGKIYVNGFDFECSLKYPYATVQIYAYYDVTVCFASINGVDFKGDVKATDSDPVIVATSGIFAQEKALVGHKYNVTYKTYNMLSGIQENKMEYKKAGETDDKYVSASSASLIEFCELGDYVVKLTTLTKEGKEANFTHNLKVVDLSEVPDNSIRYEMTKEQYDEIKESIQDKIVDSEGYYIAIGDNFYYPDVKDYIVSDFFDSDECNYKVYYANGASTTDYTSTSSKFFEITQSGKYVYFVLPTDAIGKGFTYDDDFKEKYERYDEGQNVLGVTCEMGGFYSVDRDEDGEVTAVHDLVIPVFTFSIDNNAKPKITIVMDDTGVIGTEYKITSITIGTSNTKKTEYKLYFMSKSDRAWYEQNKGKAFDKDSFDKDEEYLAEFNALIDGMEINGKTIKLVEITDESDEEFNSSNLTFTPKNKGAYYCKCSVTADNESSDSAVTYAIVVNKTASSNKYEKQFMKYNWKSFVYLGISVVSAIGIICLIFIKPKKKKSDNNEI